MDSIACITPPGGIVYGINQSKKIGWLDGLRALYVIARERLRRTPPAPRGPKGREKYAGTDARGPEGRDKHAGPAARRAARNEASTDARDPRGPGEAPA